MTKIERISSLTGIDISDPTDFVNAIEIADIKLDSSDPRFSIGKFPIEYSNTILGTSLTIKNNRGNNFDVLKLIADIVPELQLLGGEFFAGLHHGAHVVQFENGHLQKDGGLGKPMFSVPDPNDETVLLSLKRFKPFTAEASMNNMLDPKNQSDFDRASGFFETVGDIFNGGSRERVAKALGFNTVSKDSELEVEDKEGKKSKCVAKRLCVHSKEFEKDEVAAAITDVYEKMIKLEKDSPVVIGLKEKIEIVIDQKKISIHSEYNSLFVKTLSTVFESLNIARFDNAMVQYEEIKEDSKAKLWIDNKLRSIEKCAKDISNYLHINRKKLKASFILTSMIMIFAMLIIGHVSLLQLIFILLPATAFVILVIMQNEEMDIFDKIGDDNNTKIYLVIMALCLISGLADFKEYIIYLVIIIFAIIILVLRYIVLEEEIEEIGTSIMNYSRIVPQKFDLLFNKAMENPIAFPAMLVILVISAIPILSVVGLGLIIVTIALIALFTIVSILDIKFWKGVKKEQKRQFLKQTSGFRKARPELSEDCEVTVNIMKCKILRNPLRGFLPSLLKNLQDNYPEGLGAEALKQKFSKSPFGKVFAKAINITQKS